MKSIILYFQLTSKHFGGNHMTLWFAVTKLWWLQLFSLFFWNNL